MLVMERYMDKVYELWQGVMSLHKVEFKTPKLRSYQSQPDKASVASKSVLNFLPPLIIFLKKVDLTGQCQLKGRGDSGQNGWQGSLGPIM